MKFRTKIWMLPFSAALVFVVGVVVSYFVGASTLGALHRLSQVEAPALQQLRQAHQGIEQFRLLLQSAAVEGDAEKLQEVDASVARTREVLSQLGAIPGKRSLADRLLEHWNAYQAAAVGATRAMLAREEAAEHVQRMQAAQGQLETMLKAQLQETATLNNNLQAQAVRGVETSLWVTLGIGVVVLAVLGLASVLLIRSVWRELGEEPGTLRLQTRRIADGDLQVQARSQDGEGRSLDAAIGAMARRLRETVGTIREASASIAVAAREIAAGNAELSARTEASASNLQETAASIGQLTDAVQQSAEAAREASQLAGSANEAARRGGEIVGQVVTNMDEISVASARIGDIIGVIDGIAFQTNILALNAAVEAARAGEQGRGFAVVAGEVRSLAQRSAQAAREVKELITTSGAKVQGGTRLVQDAGAAMQEIVAGVQRVQKKIEEISTAAAAQATSIGEVHRAADQLEAMTQQNSALVEEASAAAGSMRDLAIRLQTVVDAFQVGTAAPGAAPAAHRRSLSLQAPLALAAGAQPG